ANPTTASAITIQRLRRHAARFRGNRLSSFIRVSLLQPRSVMNLPLYRESRWAKPRISAPSIV
ncbi:MAG: hypothetical protein ACYDCD_13505, partial [Candidatus Acidiferrales bacterium]